MRLAQIELQGFKSYKDKLETDQFSPKINVVVGANGSGKSNFFHGGSRAHACGSHAVGRQRQTLIMFPAAIRFVLNDVNSMRVEERQQLLHVRTIGSFHNGACSPETISNVAGCCIIRLSLVTRRRAQAMRWPRRTSRSCSTTPTAASQ